MEMNLNAMFIRVKHLDRECMPLLMILEECYPGKKKKSQRSTDFQCKIPL